MMIPTVLTFALLSASVPADKLEETLYRAKLARAGTKLDEERELLEHVLEKHALDQIRPAHSDLSTPIQTFFQGFTLHRC